MWFFGYFEVYIIILFGFGIISYVILIFVKKLIFGYLLMVLVMVVIGILGFVVWVYYMYMVGMLLI